MLIAETEGFAGMQIWWGFSSDLPDFLMSTLTLNLHLLELPEENESPTLPPSETKTPQPLANLLPLLSIPPFLSTFLQSQLLPLAASKYHLPQEGRAHNGQPLPSISLGFKAAQCEPLLCVCVCPAAYPEQKTDRKGPYAETRLIP